MGLVTSQALMMMKTKPRGKPMYTRGGDVVWAKHGWTWYPAKVMSRADVPENLHTSLFRNKVDELVVQWYGENTFSWKRTSQLDHLSENRIDSSRASRSNSMLLLYQGALAHMRMD